LEYVGLNLAYRSRHALPSGVAQVKARAGGEDVVIGGAVLRQLRCTENAERDVARGGGRQSGDAARKLIFGAAPRARSKDWSTSVHAQENPVKPCYLASKDVE